MESGSSLLSMVNSGQVGRALKVYGSWQCEMYCALERVSGRSARRRADRASVTRVEMLKVCSYENLLDRRAAGLIGHLSPHVLLRN